MMDSPIIHVAGRLVEHQRATDVLLDDEEAVIALDYGSSGKIGTPDHAGKYRDQYFGTLASHISSNSCR